jgi:hypothetical protein
MFGFLIQTIFIVLLPAMFVGGAAILSWPQIGRPWLFVAFSLVILYAAYVAIFYWMQSQVVGYSVVETGQALDGAKNYSVADHNGEVSPSFMGPYMWHLLAFTVLAIPTLWFSVKLFGGKAS